MITIVINKEIHDNELILFARENLTVGCHTLERSPLFDPLAATARSLIV